MRIISSRVREEWRDPDNARYIFSCVHDGVMFMADIRADSMASAIEKLHKQHPYPRRKVQFR